MRRSCKVFESEVLRQICIRLKPLTKKADALWAAYITAETPDSKREAEALIRLFELQYLSREVDDATIRLPPPTATASSGEFFLGTVMYGNRPLHPLYLRRENFMKHVNISAISGGGKSNVSQVLVLGLLAQGVPFLVLDWKRAYRDLLTVNAPGVERLRIFSVGRKAGVPFNWNPLRAPPGVHPKTWISVVAEALEKSHISGPGVADVLIEMLNKKFEEFGVYDNTHEQHPNFFDAAESVGRLQLRGRRMLWQDSAIRILRTFTFGPAAGAFNSRHPIKLEELLTHPVIIELDAELPKPLRVFMSDVVLRWLHLFRLGQRETNELRHVTILEECHNLFPKTLLEKQATNSLETVFREIRSFGEGLVNISQHPSLLPIYVLGNSNTLISLGLQHEEDIFTARKALFLNPKEEPFLDRLAVGEGIVKIKGRIQPCHVRFPLVPVRRGIVTDEMLAKRGDVVGTTHLD